MIVLPLADDFCAQLYELGTQHRGQNLLLHLDGKDVLLVQHEGDADVIFRRQATDCHKNLRWFRQVVGASRITEDGHAWEARRELSQFALSRFDRAASSSACVAAGRGLALALASTSGDTLDEHAIHAHLLALFTNVFLDTPLAHIGVCPAHSSRLIELAGEHAFHRPGQAHASGDAGARRKRLREVLALREDVFGSLKRFQLGELPRNPLIERLLQAEDSGLAHYSMAQEMFILLGAGTDSSEISVGWALHALARQPDVQDRLHASLRAARQGCTEAQWTEVALAHSDLGRFVGEVLRIYPPFPFVSRVAQAPLDLHDCAVQAGEVVLVSLIGLGQLGQPGDAEKHGAAAIDPWHVDLDRAVTASGPLARSGQSAFLWGPRVCAGMNFAWMEMMLVMAELVLALEFQATSAQLPQFRWSAQMRRLGGQRVRCRLRQE